MIIHPFSPAPAHSMKYTTPYKAIFIILDSSFQTRRQKFKGQIVTPLLGQINEMQASDEPQ